MFAQHVVLLKYSFSTIERVLSDPRHPWTAGLDGAGGADLLARVGVTLLRPFVFGSQGLGRAFLKLVATLVATNRTTAIRK